MLKELEFKNEATNMMKVPCHTSCATAPRPPTHHPHNSTAQASSDWFCCTRAPCTRLPRPMTIFPSPSLPQIRVSLETAGIPVTVPMVVPGMATTRVLTMQFISGFKLNEYGALRRAGADLKELTGIVCDALAHQMYVLCGQGARCILGV